MGKSSGGARKDVTKRPALTANMHEIAPILMDFYGLKDEMALDDLLTLLHSYSCRDQDGEPEDPSPEDLAQRRATGHALVQKIVAGASQALKLIDDIELTRAEFDEVVSDNPSVLEEIFEVDVGPPDILFFPPELDAFKTFYGSIGGAETEAAFAALAATPVRPKLNRGPVSLSYS